jgi:hypothetical protein
MSELKLREEYILRRFLCIHFKTRFSSALESTVNIDSLYSVTTVLAVLFTVLKCGVLHQS